MSMEAKKISFGFNKINKKPNILARNQNAKTESKVELIKCLEDQEIKLVQEKPLEKTLVIPLKESATTPAALASLLRRRAVILGEEEPEKCNENSKQQNVLLSNQNSDDIEKRAVHELLSEVTKNDHSDQTQNLILPLVKPEDLPLEGAEESTLNDYESIPIQDFGKAILRGMGWTEPLPKTNKKRDAPLDDAPVARPKGMGLGADKALTKRPLLVAPEVNEVLEIKRNAFVLILGGKHKGLYGQIEGFDDNACRVIVKMAIGGSKEVFNEFLCQPVSKKEYVEYGKCISKYKMSSIKCINSSKYEEYKKKESECNPITSKKYEKKRINRNELNLKEDQTELVEYEHQKNNSSDRNLKHDDYKEYKRHIEKHNKIEDSIKASIQKHRNDYKRESNSDDVDQKREHNDTNLKMEGNQREQEYEKYESKSYSSNRNDIGPNYIHHRRNRDSNIGQGERSAYNSMESEAYSSTHKKSSKAYKKKSKKSKKNKSKSKYKRNSSDTDTNSSSVDSSSDSEAEQHKKYRKKTKKSKKQRERSRSRTRRV